MRIPLSNREDPQKVVQKLISILAHKSILAINIKLHKFIRPTVPVWERGWVGLCLFESVVFDPSPVPAQNRENPAARDSRPLNFDPARLPVSQLIPLSAREPNRSVCSPVLRLAAIPDVCIRATSERSRSFRTHLRSALIVFRHSKSENQTEV